MNRVILILFVILCSLIIRNLALKRKEEELPPQFLIDTTTTAVIYDNKPLHRLALKTIKKNKKPVDCRTTIVECDRDADCHSLCAAARGGSQCTNGFCAYVEESYTCQNGGIPVSYFHRGHFNYTGCICPLNFIGRFCDVPNNMLTAVP